MLPQTTRLRQRKAQRFGSPVGFGSRVLDAFGRLRGDPTAGTEAGERAAYGDFAAVPAES